jgi:uncharacterized protein (DUF58 family)
MKNWRNQHAQAVRDWLGSRVRERITTTGAVFMGAMFLTGLAAFASANNLLFLLLATMLATLLVSGFVSRLGIAGLQLDVQLPDHIAARRPSPARLILRNEKGWMPSFSIHLVGVEESVFSTPLYFPLVPGGGSVETTLDVRFERRGIHSEDSFLFSSRFPFGFAERRAKVTMNHEVLVYPALEPQPGFEDLFTDLTGEAETRFRGRSHDFYRIRPYQNMESARHMDWRATAHTSEMQIREFAREEEHLFTLFLDLQVAREFEPWFELAVECCAFVAWRCAQSGARVRFRTQDFEVLVPVEGDVYVILKYLALVESRHKATPLKNLEEECVAIVFTAAPGRLADCGWGGARVIDPDSPLFSTAPRAASDSA